MLGWPHTRQFPVSGCPQARFFALPIMFNNSQWESTLKKSRCLLFQVFTHILLIDLIDLIWFFGADHNTSQDSSWQLWAISVCYWRLPAQVSVRSRVRGIATVVSLLQVVGVSSDVLGEYCICIWRILLLKNMLKLSLCLWSPTFFKMDQEWVTNKCVASFIQYVLFFGSHVVHETCIPHPHPSQGLSFRHLLIYLSQPPPSCLSHTPDIDQCQMIRSKLVRFLLSIRKE